MRLNVVYKAATMFNEDPCWLAYCSSESSGDVVSDLISRGPTTELAMAGLLYKLLDYVNRKEQADAAH